MKPANTDSQSVRRKNAILGAVSATLFRLAIVAIALWLRAGMDPARLTAKVLLMVLVLDLGSIPFIWVSLKNRLQEIQG